MSGQSPVGTWALPLSTGPGVQTPSVYKGNIDAGFAVAQRVADAFAPRPAASPNMTVILDAGFVARVDPTGIETITEVATQTLTIGSAPSAPNSRIDLVVIDAGTGTASVVAGTAANPGVAPTLAAGQRQIAQVAVASSTTAIAAANITDLRAVWGPMMRVPWAVATGTADALTAAFTPATPNPIPDGYEIDVRAIAANATTTPTLNPDGRGNVTITKNGGQALLAGDIAGAGFEGRYRYHSATPNWEMQNPSNPVPSGFTTGDRKETYKTVADPGWVMMDDGTIGDASSGATTRANADTSALFTLLWNNISNGNCPVSGGRGASAAADFAAHKTINLPLTKGRAVASAGTGSGLSARNLGDAVGAETVTLSSTQQASMPVSSTTVTVTSTSPTVGAGACCGSSGINDNSAVNSLGAVITSTGSLSGQTATGGGNPHNNMQPSSFVNFMIKL